MNYIDLFCIVLLVYAVFTGFTRGFIRQLALIAALVVGVYGALKLSGYTARLLESRLNVNTEYLYLVSLGITFLMVFIGVNLLGRLVEKIAENAELSFINRLLGVAFSLVKIILILGILLAYIDRIDHNTRILPQGSKERSLFFKPFTSVVRAIFPSLQLPKQSGTETETDFV
jgi:membrane protein required for colicin V production